MAPASQAVRYVEASGLGEPYGDAIEVGAYNAVLSPGRRADDPVAVGSIHTNIAHLDGASGIASLLKASLTNPTQLHCIELYGIVVYCTVTVY